MEVQAGQQATGKKEAILINGMHIRLKNRLPRQWKITRDPALKPEVIRLQRSVTHRLNEWRIDQWSATLESFDPEEQSLWRMTKRVMKVPNPLLYRFHIIDVFCVLLFFLYIYIDTAVLMLHAVLFSYCS